MRWSVLLALAGCWRGPVAEPVVDAVKPPTHHRRWPARAVARIGDELWVAMGTCSDSALYRSLDRGNTWIPLDLGGDNDPLDITGVERIVGGLLADDVAVLGATCLGNKPTRRYHLWVSNTHGAAWSYLDPPPKFRGGFVTMGYVGRRLQFSWRNGEVTGDYELSAKGEWQQLWRSANGSSQTATIDGVTYRPSRDGLIVEVPAGAKTVYPR